MDVSCIFVIDLVPSNAGKQLRFKDFRTSADSPRYIGGRSA
jgi:hypothetical protein